MYFSYSILELLIIAYTHIYIHTDLEEIVFFPWVVFFSRLDSSLFHALPISWLHI